jgi:HEAT repeat protein
VGAAPLSAEYDSVTRRLVGASSTDDAGSRIQLMLTLLRAAGRRDAAPLFEAFAQSGPFHARWQAMREFLGLDPEAALPCLRAMAAHDPHPEVRAAAGGTLAALFETLEPDPCPA